MNLLRKTLTRRAALGGSTAVLALAALGWWIRSAIPVAMRSPAAVSEAAVPTLTAGEAPVAAEAVAAPAAASGASHTAAAGTPPVVPFGGAGLFDVDPDQGSVNQDPHVEVISDIAALPLDMEF
ncbi:MAG TPA: hypothetical protein VKF59_14590 [Candidatus Dormibacteraeota bacterium]|nr:hypothetical protein [Candidatus Dormibacteraeota bacterium]